MIISRFIHVVARGNISFFFMAEYYSIVYMYHIFSIHSTEALLNFCLGGVRGGSLLGEKRVTERLALKCHLHIYGRFI